MNDYFEYFEIECPFGSDINVGTKITVRRIYDY